MNALSIIPFNLHNDTRRGLLYYLHFRDDEHVSFLKMIWQWLEEQGTNLAPGTAEPCEPPHQLPLVIESADMSKSAECSQK